MNLKITTDTPYLAQTGELRDVYCEDWGEGTFVHKIPRIYPLAISRFHLRNMKSAEFDKICPLYLNVVDFASLSLTNLFHSFLDIFKSSLCWWHTICICLPVFGILISSENDTKIFWDTCWAVDIPWKGYWTPGIPQILFMLLICINHIPHLIIE